MSTSLSDLSASEELSNREQPEGHAPCDALPEANEALPVGRRLRLLEVFDRVVDQNHFCGPASNTARHAGT